MSARQYHAKMALAMLVEFITCLAMGRVADAAACYRHGFEAHANWAFGREES